MSGDQSADRGIGLFGRRIEITGLGFVDLDREKKIVPVAAPAQRILTAAGNRLFATPHLEALALGRLEADTHEAWIIRIAFRFTETDHGKGSGLRQQIAGRTAHVIHLQRGQGVDRSRGCRFNRSHVGSDCCCRWIRGRE